MAGLRTGPRVRTRLGGGIAVPGGHIAAEPTPLCRWCTRTHSTVRPSWAPCSSRAAPLERRPRRAARAPATLHPRPRPFPTAPPCTPLRPLRRAATAHDRQVIKSAPPILCSELVRDSTAPAPELTVPVVQPGPLLTAPCPSSSMQGSDCPSLCDARLASRAGCGVLDRRRGVPGLFLGLRHAHLLLHGALHTGDPDPNPLGPRPGRPLVAPSPSPLVLR